MNTDKFGFENVFELLGDVISYEKDAFTPLDTEKRRATEGLFLIGFSETEYDDETDFLIPAGDLFDIVGDSDGYDMYMISYKGQLFGCEKNETDLSSEAM